MKTYQLASYLAYLSPLIFFALGFTYIILGGDSPVNQRTLGSSFLALGVGAILVSNAFVLVGRKLKEIELRLDNMEKSKQS
jgi:hypothetical protein